MFAQKANTHRLKYVSFTSVSLYIGTISHVFALDKTICIAISLKAEWMHFNKLPASFWKKYIYTLVDNHT
jgi:hypothetical protein